MNPIKEKLKFVITISTIFAIIMLVSCSKKEYTITIKDITIDGTKCTFSLNTSDATADDLSVLLTENHKPDAARDGFLYNQMQFTHTFTESGTKTVYLTLVKNDRLVSQSLEHSLEVFHEAKLSHFEYQLENGVLKISVFPKLNNMIYTVQINGNSYNNDTGDFSIPISKEDIDIIISAIQNNELKFGVISKTISTKADEPPKITIPVPENGYDGKWIPFFVTDDWDRHENLTVMASIYGISMFFIDNKLFPEYEIPEGEHTLEASVIDSFGNISTVSKDIKIVKSFEESIPELYIEEGGYFRIASWKNVEANTEVKIERFKNGNWEEIIQTEDHSPLRISSEFVSEGKGDLYRLSLASTKTHYLPSVPVFAKSEPLRRLTSTYVLSLMGADTLFGAGEDYYLQGRIAVGETKHLRIEPEVTVKIGRGSSLLVNGSIELDGRRGRISFISLASSDGIRVGSGGVMLARNVDFGNTSIIGEEGSVVILENCNLDTALNFSGTYLQIFDSSLDGGLILKNSDESVIYNVKINESFISNNIKNTIFVNSDINCSTGAMDFSKINAYQSTFELEELSVKNVSTLNFYHCDGLVNMLKINNGSKVYIGTSDFQKGAILVEKISSVVIPEKLRDIINVESDDKSNIVFY
ncbi:MAG: hypothetical protein R6U52_03690 [Kosmotogaceae bacterium]